MGAEEYRRRLFRKYWNVEFTAVGGSGDNTPINLEGGQGAFAFMEVCFTGAAGRCTPPQFPAPADDEHYSSRPSDEDDDPDAVGSERDSTAYGVEVMFPLI